MSIPSERLDGLPEDCSSFGFFFCLCESHHSILEEIDGACEVGGMYHAPLDLKEGVVSGCFIVMEDLREEGVLVIGGGHDSEEMAFLSLVRLLLSCKTFPPWS